MTCLDDVAAGDVSQEGIFLFKFLSELMEDVDPRFHHTFQLAQFSVQYLLSCQQLLTKRTQLIENALQTFDAEEIELDFQIAKLRSFLFCFHC